MENEEIDKRQVRRFLLTINNEKMSDEELIQYVQGLEHFKYCMFQREKGEKENTEHIQMFLVFTISKWFSTVKNYFPRAHIEAVKGSNVQARDYCSKSETRVSGPHEIGQFAEERARTDIKGLYDMIDNNASNIEIRTAYPKLYLQYMDKIEKVRQENLFNKYSKEIRQVQVVYLYGKAGVGKTRFIYDKYGFENVYRITKYNNASFDNYSGQPVIVFDEFDTSFKITEMLNYLDIYPLWLPCRFANKVACYTKVYIISNLPLHEQYYEIQRFKTEQFRAFKRRIHKIVRIKQNAEKLIEYDCTIHNRQLFIDFDKVVSLENNLEIYNGEIPFKE